MKKYVWHINDEVPSFKGCVAVGKRMTSPPLLLPQQNSSQPLHQEGMSSNLSPLESCLGLPTVIFPVINIGRFVVGCRSFTKEHCILAEFLFLFIVHLTGPGRLLKHLWILLLVLIGRGLGRRILPATTVVWFGSDALKRMDPHSDDQSTTNVRNKGFWVDSASIQRPSYSGIDCPSFRSLSL